MCLWLLAGVIVVMQAAAQFTTMNRASLASPGLRSRMVSSRAQSSDAHSRIARLAKKDDDDDASAPAGPPGPTEVFMSIPYASFAAVMGASAASKVIGAFAETFETKPAKKK